MMHCDDLSSLSQKSGTFYAIFSVIIVVQEWSLQFWKEELKLVKSGLADVFVKIILKPWEAENRKISEIILGENQGGARQGFFSAPMRSWCLILSEALVIIHSNSQKKFGSKILKIVALIGREKLKRVHFFYSL